eukprot:5725893-Pyramimonas_sp.AAC.3
MAPRSTNMVRGLGYGPNSVRIPVIDFPGTKHHSISSSAHDTVDTARMLLARAGIPKLARVRCIVVTQHARGLPWTLARQIRRERCREALTPNARMANINMGDVGKVIGRKVG